MIVFAKPFRYLRGEGTIYKPSIVTFARIPWMTKYAQRFSTSPQVVGIAQYKYYLYINLWLFELHFNWMGKDSTKRTYSKNSIKAKDNKNAGF